MDSNIKKELINEIDQLHIKEEENDFELIAMPIPVVQCVALTKLTSNVEIYSVDENEIAISGNGISHVFMHGPKLYEVKSLQSKIRVVLKQIIKEDTYDVDGEQYKDDYRFDLTLDFALGNKDSQKFIRQLDDVGYNS